MPMPLLIGGVLAIPLTIGMFVLVNAKTDADRTENRTLSMSKTMPFTDGDSRTGCDRKGNDVFACSQSEITLRPRVVALWEKATPEQRFACLQGVGRTFGPLSQLHSCLST